VIGVEWEQLNIVEPAEDEATGGSAEGARGPAAPGQAPPAPEASPAPSPAAATGAATAAGADAGVAAAGVAGAAADAAAAGTGATAGGTAAAGAAAVGAGAATAAAAAARDPKPAAAAGAAAGSRPPDAGAAAKAARAATHSLAPDRIVRVDTEQLDSLLNLVGELVIHRIRLREVSAEERQRNTALAETMEQIDRITDSMQDAGMALRMVPVGEVFARFPRVVRDIARKFNKRIELITEGEETELDRSIVHRLGDPLVHLT